MLLNVRSLRWNKWLLWVALVWCGVLLSLVYFRSPDPQAVHPYFGFYPIMMGLTGSVLLFSLAGRGRFRLVFSDGLVLAFVGYGWVQWMVLDTGADTRTGVLLLLGATYFCFRRVLSSHSKGWLVLSLVLVVAGLVEAWWGLRQLYGFSAPGHFLFPLTGSFFNPGPYSGFLALVLPLAIYLMLRYRAAFRPGWRGMRLFCSGVFYLSTAAVCSILLVLPAGMSRSSWLAALAGSIWVLARHFSWSKGTTAWFRTPRKRLVPVLGALLFGIMVLGAGMYYLKKPSADGRLLMWKISARAWLDDPVTGVGAGRFSGAFGEAQAAYFSSGGTEYEAWVSGTPEYGFNEYLQVAVEFGAVGLILLVLLLWGAFRERYRNRNFPPGISGGLLALLVFAAFSYPFNLLPFLLVLVFFLACAASGMSKRSGMMLPRWGAVLLFAVLSGGSFALWQKSIPEREAQHEWADLKLFIRNSLPQDDDMACFERIYPHLNDQVPFLFDYGKALAGKGLYEQSNEQFLRALDFRGDPMLCVLIGKNFQAMEEYALAEEWLVKASNMGPNRLYPHYLLAKLFADQGLTEKAADKARYVLGKTPKVVSSATNEMKDEMRALLQNLGR